MSVIVKEGLAEVELADGGVFYNPVQEFNRDLSVCVIRAFAKLTVEPEDECGSPYAKKFRDSAKHAANRCKDGITVFEAFSATGLRAIRYAKEVPHIRRIVANDLSPSAVEMMRRNVANNNVSSMISVSQEDAATFMYQNRSFDRRFDVIDLDPYGSASRFIDSAVQCVSDGGLLMVTCTDVAVLCGNTPETCFSKYGSMSLKAKCCHEIALRILLCCIDSRANCYGRYIEPLLSVSADFYVRVFVRVKTGPLKVKNSACKKSFIYQCTGCESFELQPMARSIKGTKFVNAVGPSIDKLCAHCENAHHIAGPLWSDQIHDGKFVDHILQQVLHLQQSEHQLNTTDRLIGLLSLVKEELADVPLYYSVARLASILHITTPKQNLMRSAILNAGYRVSATHAHPSAIKTDAPSALIWDIMRTWAKENRTTSSLSDKTPAFKILQKDPKHHVDFTHHKDSVSASKAAGLLRYQENPTKNWGPQMRAKTTR